MPPCALRSDGGRAFVLPCSCGWNCSGRDSPADTQHGVAGSVMKKADRCPRLAFEAHVWTGQLMKPRGGAGAATAGDGSVCTPSCWRTSLRIALFVWLELQRKGFLG